MEPRALFAGDPLLTSWLGGSLGEYATIIDPANVAAGPKTTWTGQTAAVLADIHKVSSSANYVYVATPELASYIMGPWFRDAAQTQPSTNYPTDQGSIFRFDRTPSPATVGNHVETQQFTPIGLLVNGVPIFNQQDGFSYKNSSAADLTGGDRYWHRNAAVSEQLTFDHGNGHAPINGDEYHTHLNPEALRAQLNDNIFYSGPANPDLFPYDSVATQADTDTDFYDEATASFQHSPIIGWALDGYPIYGPYGYSDPMDAGSSVERLDSSYRLRNITTRTTLPGFAAKAKFGDNVSLNVNGEYALTTNFYGPVVSPQFPLGHYIEDYEYVAGLGDLDIYNSRFTVTPEFPLGTQAYFVTIDAFGSAAFPYFIGRQFFGDVTSSRVSQIFETVNVSFDIANTPPTFTNIPDQCVYTNQVVGPLTYHLSDTHTLPGNLTVQVTSSNTALVPLSNIEMVGSGTSRTIKVTPATNVNGLSVITLIATDELGKSSSESFTVTVTSGLNPPTLNPLIPAVGAVPPTPKIVIEDSGQHALALSGISDADCDLQELRVTATTSDPNLIRDLSVAYTSNMPTGTAFFKTVADAAGTANLYVTVEDGGYDGLLSTPGDNQTFSQAIQIVVNQAPDAPTMNPFSPNPLEVNEDSAPVTVTFSGVSDGDDNTQELLITATSSDTNLIPSPTVAYTSPSTTGSMTFQPVAQKSGTAIITVYITDGGPDGLLSTPAGNLTSQKQLTVNVKPINDLPRVNPPVTPLNVSENPGNAAPTVITLTGIDAGPFENQPMYMSVSSNNTAVVPTPTWTFTPPTPGVPLSGSATITFTPVANKSGTATLRVKLIDAGLDGNLQITSDNGVTEKLIVVNVNPVNDPPTLNPIPAITIKQGGTFDPASTLAAAVISPTQQSITVTSAANFPTNTPFFIKVDSEQMKVTAINANQFTVLRAQGGTAGATHSAAAAVAMLPILNGITAGGGEQQHLKVTAAIQSTSIPGLIQLMNPTVNYTSPETTGTLKFTAGPGLFGTAVIRVTVEDDGVDGVLNTAGDNATTFQDLTVTVSNKDDLPTLADLAPMTLYEDGATGNTITIGGISDGDLNTQQIQVTATSSNPGLVPTPAVGFTQSGVSPSTSLQSATLTFNGLAADQTGNSTITVTVTDGGADGLLSTTNDNQSVIKSFLLTIANFNDPPTLDPLTPVGLNEGAGAQTVTLTGITAGSGELSQSVTVSATSNVPAAFSSLSVVGNTLSFTPSSDASGIFTISVTARDNGPDLIANNSDDASFTQPLTVTITNTDNDAPTLAPFSPNVRTVPINSGATVVPLTGIGDGAFEVGPVTISVMSNNTGLIPPPTLSFSPASSSAGSLTFTPMAGQSGTATVTVTVTDGGADHDPGTTGDGELSVSQQFTINVVVPPTLDGISDPTPINEDAGTQFISFNGVSPGPGPIEAMQPVQVTATVLNIPGMSDPALLENLSVNYTNPNAAGQLSYNPVANKYGTALVEVKVTDGGPDNILATTDDNSSTTQTFAVAVLPINDPPSFNSIGTVTLQEDGSALTITPTGVSAGPFESNQKTRITGILVGASGIVTVSQGANPNTVKLTPVANASGTTQVTITIEDSGPDLNLLSTFDNLTYSETITVNVNGENDVPTLNSINNVTVNEDSAETTIVLSGIGAGADELQTLTLSASSSDPLKVPHPIIDYVPGSSVANLRFTPNSDATGTVTITVTVTDDNSILTDPTPKQVQKTFNITINPVNDAPTFDPLQTTSFSLDENTPAGTTIFTIGASDIDSPAGDILLSIIGGNAQNAFKIESGVVKVNTASALNYEVNPSISFTVKATNPNSLLPPAQKTFVVNLNDLNETVVVGANDWGAGTSGLIVRRDSGKLRILNATTLLDAVKPHDETKVDAIQVTGRSGTSDILTLDHFGGDVVPLGGISFNGQSNNGIDELRIKNAFLSQLDASFTGAGAGTLDDPSSTDAVITLTGVEGITLESTNTISALNVLMSSGGDNATLADDGNLTNGFMKLASTTSPTLTFAVNVPLTIDLGDGADTLAVQSADMLLSSQVTVFGNLGNDRIHSSAANPLVLNGDDGNDSLIGGSNDDVLFGGVGDDILSGGLGNDTFDGGADIDTLYESADVNFTLGANSLDGLGSDSFTDVEQAHLVGGNSGNAIDATGFNGSTTLNGAGGADTINGGNGDDLLIGGDGDDLLDGFGGANTISESGNFNFVLNDATLTGRGTDTYSNISFAWLIGGTGNNSITIQPSFTGNATLDGGAGNDTLIGSEQADVIYGGDGADGVGGRAGNDTIFGGTGNDSLNGGDDDDNVSGEAGNDTLAGGDGTNDLNGGTEDDQVCEVGDYDMEFLSAVQLSISGIGLDTLTSIESAKLVGGISGNRLDATNFDKKVSLFGADGDDTLLGGSKSDSLDGGSGNDVLSGGSDHSTVAANAGNDTLNGGAGTDMVYESLANKLSLNVSGTGTSAKTTMTGRGTDSLVSIETAYLVGTSGADTISGGTFAGTMFIDGGDGIDSLNGGNGNDTILGGNDGDILNGMAGNDSIRGGAGNDKLAGGSGSDSLLGDEGDDYLNGQGGNDKLVGGDGGDLMLGGEGNDSLAGLAGNDTLKGDGGNDVLFGGTENDSLLGGNGNDTLLGDEGNDTLRGEVGTDVLFDPFDINVLDGLVNEKPAAFAIDFNAIFGALLGP